VVEKFVVDYNLIGDSMTLSAILLDQKERLQAFKMQKYDFRTLIVCTKGGLSVWKWHLEDQGVPSDRILVIDPSNRDYFDSELNAGALNYDYYIMHYHALPLLSFFDKVQLGRNALVWDHIIADEAHLIKNRKAERTKILKRQKARKKTAVSGTPADDKPLDIWSVLNWLDRSKYSSYWRFYNTYIKYIEEWLITTRIPVIVRSSARRIWISTTERSIPSTFAAHCRKSEAVHASQDSFSDLGRPVGPPARGL
jgi:hypothetical protein